MRQVFALYTSLVKSLQSLVVAMYTQLHLQSGVRIHTVLSCVSAAGYALPLMIIYPRKKSVPEKCKEEAIPNTLFANSNNGWIVGDLFMLWFEVFLRNIPPARPVLLIMDARVH